MVKWTSNQKSQLVRFQTESPSEEILKTIPENERFYKCSTCHQVFPSNDQVIKGVCPDCSSETLFIMCPVDHCDCNHTIVEGIDTCPICGAYVCPECGSHDVIPNSRVTGYLSPVNNWNASKQQELRDRKRVNIV